MRRGILAALLLAAGALAPAHGAAEPIRICGHVPITGAAPIPHHADRFGQFYFNAVNTEQGGVHGRPVQFTVIDDSYYPTGARAAVDRCERLGTDLYVGPTGPDQIWSVARWAEERGVPYLHGSINRAFSESVTGDASFAPTTDELAKGLAHALSANAADITGGTRPVFGMVAIHSPRFDAEVEAFRAALAERGHSLGPVVRVQKDENSFTGMYRELQGAGVNIVNVAVTPTLMYKMANRRPISYDPLFASSQPFLGSEFVASAIGDTRMVVLNDPAPVYDAFEPPDPRWADEIEEFHRIFETYSPEQSPPPDYYDWTAYLRAKQMHRMLLALEGNITPQGFFDLFESYTETPDAAFPACALDFARDPTFGQRSWHVFQNRQGKWAQVGFCADAEAVVDLAPPTISCESAGLAEQVCTFADRVSGVGSYSVNATPLVGDPVVRTEDGSCGSSVEARVSVPTGVYRIEATATDCAGSTAIFSDNAIVV